MIRRLSGVLSSALGSTLRVLSGVLVCAVADCALAGMLLLTPAHAATGAVGGTAGGTGSAGPGVLHLQVVPALRGVLVHVDGRSARSDAKGRIAVRVDDFNGLEKRLVVPEKRISPTRKVIFDRFRGDPDSGARGKVVELGVRTVRLVTWSFMDRFGKNVPISKVRSLTLRSNIGATVELHGHKIMEPLWVPESRTQQGPQGLVSKRLYYVVDSAVVGGTSVVNRAQQRFVPWERLHWPIQLLFYKVSFNSTDLLFTHTVGDGIELTRQDGTRERLPFGEDGVVKVSDLPRGTYTVAVYGGGASFARPVSISKDQEVSLEVASYLDLLLVGGTVLAIALGLIILGRPNVRLRLRRGHRLVQRGLRRVRGLPRAVVAVLVLVLALSQGAEPAQAGTGETGPPDAARDPVPTLAYYYIWFMPTSWERAKIDYPLLGRYSSDDAEIMRRHVRMAKAAGIEGFLVSWKHTPTLTRRLATLVAVAKEERFHLGIVYQGLDFEREPLPLATVRRDLTLFVEKYGNEPVFRIFDKPLVIWTGSDRLTARVIEDTAGPLRRSILLLGNAKNVETVNATAPGLDGQAYYWSSVDPTRGDSGGKLAAMARAVHLHGGLWVAPVAPGFDARLVGGQKEVPRRGGETLRASYRAARSSSPDAIGIISWNEFSENTHIEPGERYGTTDINVLADLLGARADISVAPDSSEAVSPYWGLTTWGALVVLAGGLGLLPLVIVLTRRRRAESIVRELAATGRRERQS